ncbi:hypothetical protein [Nonomuraea endophytica]|uniref:LppX_LprAFG lipoprotein n=1 Tax=Nonomuraea endophytica TaxID=714136 RepID=A0A7W7ZZT6_9ACTN|nr:hypothetical protein [Nonomuraea endophytica]MBB5076266.1 hypothetical protein [Nonomuraea endophytica]
MKKMIAAIAAAGALVAGALPAQAAPKDPVGVLKSLMKPGAGVRFSDITMMSADGGSVDLVKRKGVFAFGKKGFAAYDITSRIVSPTIEMTDSRKPERVIGMGKDLYLNGGGWAEDMPKGKTWFKTKNVLMGAGGYGFFGQVINPAELGTLSALVKRAKRSGNAYTGKVTLKELHKISPWFASTILARRDTTPVEYTINVAPSGLVTKVTSTYAAAAVVSFPGLEDETFTAVSTFTGWGKKVSVKAPDPALVTTKLKD